MSTAGSNSASANGVSDSGRSCSAGSERSARSVGPFLSLSAALRRALHLYGVESAVELAFSMTSEHEARVWAQEHVDKDEILSFVAYWSAARVAALSSPLLGKLGMPGGRGRVEPPPQCQACRH